MLAGRGFGGRHDAADFGVDHARRLLGVRAALGHERRLHERAAAAAFVVDRARSPSLMPNSVTMARAMSVARSRSFCAPVENSLNSSSSAVRPPSSTASWFSSSPRVEQIAIFERQLHRVAERAEAALHDRHLVHGIAARQHRGDNRVAGFVHGDDAAHARVHRALLFEAGDDAVDGLVELRGADRLPCRAGPPAARPR